MRKILDIITSFGAAVVIFGAWAKLLHKAYADTMLTIGLLTEAGIFVLYGVLAAMSKEEPEGTPGNLQGSIDNLTRLMRNIFRAAVVFGLMWMVGCSPKYGCPMQK